MMHAIACNRTQLVAFLDKVREYRSATPMHKRLTAHMAALYGLYNYKNSEIRCGRRRALCWPVLSKRVCVCM